MSDTTKVGDVIQIDPSHNEVFGGSFALVSEIRTWGVVAYVPIPANGGPDRAYLRVPTGAFEKIGEAAWMTLDDTPPMGTA